MQVGAHVWNGDKCGVVIANDESGVTVGYFASIETLTSDSENPSPLSSSPAPSADVVEPAAADTTEPPAPADKPVEVPATEAAPPEVDPLAALTEDERATYTRLQGKLNASAGV